VASVSALPRYALTGTADRRRISRNGHCWRPPNFGGCNMQKPRHSVPRWGLWLFWVFCALLALFGAAMIVLGAMLIYEGGSWYYALMGVATLAAAILLAMRRSTGVLLFAVAMVATIV